ncbi:hypothetical protein [Methylocystis sp. B8]|uniref:hypothetical protein n=1 Tax=Methylocystis sp. B8 TaxID=544938 RepID=UPI0010FE0B21|nr:hypothetical protein [Methylocystis sp. B8]TLG77583.1 hypothetical protein FEV16_06980 [Methylocystis sp. B8]
MKGSLAGRAGARKTVMRGFSPLVLIIRCRRSISDFRYDPPRSRGTPSGPREGGALISVAIDPGHQFARLEDDFLATDRLEGHDSMMLAGAV